MGHNFPYSEVKVSVTVTLMYVPLPELYLYWRPVIAVIMNFYASAESLSMTLRWAFKVTVPVFEAIV